jgi:hypothetical protein
MFKLLFTDWFCCEVSEIPLSMFKKRHHEGLGMKIGWWKSSICGALSFYRWRWVVNFTLPPSSSLGTILIGRWMGPGVVQDILVKRKIPTPLSVIEQFPSSSQPVIFICLFSCTGVESPATCRYRLSYCTVQVHMNQANAISQQKLDY